MLKLTDCHISVFWTLSCGCFFQKLIYYISNTALLSLYYLIYIFAFLHSHSGQVLMP